MIKSLSKREEQVLKLLLAEYSQVEICQLLELSYSRVSDIKRIIMQKWNVETMISLVIKSIKMGYLEIEEDTWEDQEPHVFQEPDVVYKYIA
ncbi:MAG: DNA-binding NarL/FixJ family response regulator [Crocinitomicaceae bacterium]|jgi:DNA-binding NarL/FixJ family response regulator